MKLRPYQIEALAAIKQEYTSQCLRQLIVLPTGSGKSILFREIPRTIGLTPGKQVWLGVHRTELVRQAAEHFSKANPDLKVGVEKASETADLDCDIVIGSIQSIGSTGDTFKPRLQRFDPERLQAFIIDEAHHSTSDIYSNVLKYFGLLKGHESNISQALLIGFTATPLRTDGIGLESVFDKIVFNRDIREMINDGWLAPINAHRIETEVDLTGVKVSHGDFVVKQLEQKVNTPERNALILNKYQELSPGKPGIVFSVDVAHSHAIASEFRRAGITAMPFSGHTPDPERERLLSMHKSGEISILVSCDALREGVDLPWAEVGIMARPTKSSLLFCQAIGRLLRPYPAPEDLAAGAAKIKQSAIILDFVDNSVKHRLCSIPSLFGLRHDFDTKGASITDTLDEIEQAQEQFKQLRLDSFRDLAQMRAVTQVIDLLKPPAIPPELDGISKLTWFAGPGSSYQIVGPMAHFSVRQNQLGQYEVSRHENGMRRLVRTFDALDAAIRQTELMIPAQDLVLLRANSRWRQEPPTSKQIYLLSTLDPKMFARFGRDRTKFSEFIMASYSKGDVSSLISERMQRKSHA